MYRNIWDKTLDIFIAFHTLQPGSLEPMSDKMLLIPEDTPLLERIDYSLDTVSPWTTPPGALDSPWRTHTNTRDEVWPTGQHPATACSLLPLDCHENLLPETSLKIS